MRYLRFPVCVYVAKDLLKRAERAEAHIRASSSIEFESRSVLDDARVEVEEARRAAREFIDAHENVGYLHPHR
jgi:hypothetical protein